MRIGLLTIIGVVWQYDSKQPTSGILLGLSDARPNFPVHVFPLPCVRANQDNGDGGITYVFVPNLLADCRRFQALVINASRINRPVDDTLPHPSNKPFLVLDVLLVEAYEDFVFGSLGSHSFASSYKTQHQASSTVKTTTP